MNDIEKRIVEAAVKFRGAFLEYHDCIRGDEEKVNDWYLRKIPKKQRLLDATDELERATDALIKERSKA